jgi:threonine dehydratase
MERVDATLADVEAALDVVREVGVRTPTVPFADGEPFLKLENLQRLGAFKIRGVWNRVQRLSDEERKPGFSTISSGNHGRALAWAANRLGVPCLVAFPEGASPWKVAAIRELNATIESMPRDALVRAHEEELWRRWPQTFIHPFAHPHTIAGQGTAGWEIADDLSDVRTVLVPVGGGGLSSGIAIAVKGRLSRAKVYGVQSEGAASLPEALKTGSAFRVDRPSTIADGIGVGMIMPSMVDLLRRNLDGCLLVSDAEIQAAMRTLAYEAKVVAEPAGAAAFAAWRRYRERLDPPVVAVVSGGNVDPILLAEILRA